MRVVVDTNVLISALLKPGSVPELAVAAILDHDGAVVLFDQRILDEYREVATRRKFRAVPRERVEHLLGSVLERGERLTDVPAFEGPMPDESDRIFVEVALSGHADAIVTGNQKDFPTGLRFQILPPAALLAMLSPPG